jgi:hypothetical protein
VTFEHFCDVLAQLLSIFLLFFVATMLMEVGQKLILGECVLDVAHIRKLVKWCLDLVSLHHRQLLIASSGAILLLELIDTFLND